VVDSKKDQPNRIFISLYGTDFRVNAKADSIADYYLNFKNLSIKYDINGAQEIYAEPTESADDKLPLELMLIKRSKRLYLLFLSPKKGVEQTPNILYNMVR
jgi:hypothetical protein